MGEACIPTGPAAGKPDELGPCGHMSLRKVYTAQCKRHHFVPTHVKNTLHRYLRKYGNANLKRGLQVQGLRFSWEAASLRVDAD